ncbi:alpha-amylase family glycosyl hydrolase [Bacillus songklensis]|uniref:Alpha-amylase family glycosyl hydrolase n=1 Tax=Bacillus songklensis TaxID=1069116 RepID=A0ABV8B387_9BACI
MIHKRIVALFLPLFLLFGSLPSMAAGKEENRWQDELIYSIMIDRFNNSRLANDRDIDVNDPNAYHGGDLKGIMDKLDYIHDMGFTTIVLSPLFKSDSYDGGTIKDFYKVDEHYGTMKEFKQLVKEAHKRNMKVVASFITSSDENEMVKAGSWWIEQTNIDGYKMSKLEEASLPFWEKFVKEVKAAKEGFYLMGELPEEDVKNRANYERIGFDSLIDYSLYNQTSETFSKINSSQKMLQEQWQQTESTYKNPLAVGTMIDNENTARFTRKALEHRRHPGTRTKLALTHLFSSPGIPTVYYGTEIALDGGEKPDNHRMMNFRVDKELIDYVTKLSEVRNQLPSLRRGTFERLYEKGGMVIYKRQYKGETAVIAINNTSKTQIIDLGTKQLGEEKELRGLLEDDIIRPAKEGYRIALDREKANIYVLADKTGLNMKFVVALVVVYGAFMTFIYLAWKRGRARNK